MKMVPVPKLTLIIIMIGLCINAVTAIRYDLLFMAASLVCYTIALAVVFLPDK